MCRGPGVGVEGGVCVNLERLSQGLNNLISMNQKWTLYPQ